MASTFKFHSQTQETVPWSAQYAFPTQSVKVKKQTVKLVPKNGSTFSSGNKIVRIEFPADNYLNVLNSVLQFDLKITGTPDANVRCLALQQGGAQNIIKRLRVMYGSLVIEDIQDYKTLVRIFTEAGVSEDYMSSTGTLLDGMYTTKQAQTGSQSAKVLAVTGTLPGTNSPADVQTAITASLQTVLSVSATNVSDLVVGRELLNTIATPTNAVGTAGYTLNTDTGAYDEQATTRTFCLNLLSGLLTQKKLIPLKWMASQLSLEITLADFADAFIAVTASGDTAGTLDYQLKNVNFIAEMVEFDSTYDAAFMMGLAKTGVPIHFSSFHWHTFNFNGSNQTFQIHERARSVKAVYAVIRDSATPSVFKDSDNFYADLTLAPVSTGTGALTYTAASAPGGRLLSYQFRIGGQYYPAQPVRCDAGGAEAYVELLKAINYLGDYTVPTNIDYTNWTNYNRPAGATKFIMATELENTDVMPDSISGINAEEQNDIALNIRAQNYDQTKPKQLTVYCHYDSLLIIRDQNTVDLIF